MDADIGGVGANVISCRPASARWETGAVLKTATTSGSVVRTSRYTVLIDGCSNEGRSFRLPVGKHMVVSTYRFPAGAT